MKVAIIFGGAGYIGSFLISELINNNSFDKIYSVDLKSTPFLKILEDANKVKYIKGDVRKPISLKLTDINISKSESWIFNFAAIHREPGHDYKEYFDTNVPGAYNINEYARQTGIKNIFFTSSIAPYGKSLKQRTEKSNLYPETAYGISKALAEKIHQNWLGEDKTRRLVIVRPSVIYGPKDPGNVYRMIKGLKRGTFILPGDGNIIKGYGYVYGLIESIIFTINQGDRVITYNYAENPVVPLKDMAKLVKEEFKYRKPLIHLPINILVVIAFFVQICNKILRKKSNIHPVRVKKAGFPTNIKPQYLINHGFQFNYGFEKSLKHWKSVSPEDFF